MSASRKLGPSPDVAAAFLRALASDLRAGVLPDELDRSALSLDLVAACIEREGAVFRHGRDPLPLKKRLAVAAWIVEHRPKGWSVRYALEHQAGLMAADMPERDLQDICDSIGRMRKKEKKASWPLFFSLFPGLDF